MNNFNAKEKYNINDLIEVMAILRSENGCPWDAEQTHKSIRKNFIEETYEAVEAIDNDDKLLLKEELGDVLLQVVFHSQMEAEQGTFDFSDVADGITKKLIERHPHIFGDVKAESSAEVHEIWEEVKRRTKHRKKGSGQMLSVPRQLPALMRANKLQDKAQNIGFFYDNAADAIIDLKQRVQKLEESLENSDTTNISEDIGELLFAGANLSRLMGEDAEEALTKANDNFINRFVIMEKLLEEKDSTVEAADASELCELWKKAKDIEL